LFFVLFSEYGNRAATPSSDSDSSIEILSEDYQNSDAALSAARHRRQPVINGGGISRSDEGDESEEEGRKAKQAETEENCGTFTKRRRRQSENSGNFTFPFHTYFFSRAGQFLFPHVPVCVPIVLPSFPAYVLPFIFYFPYGFHVFNVSILPRSYGTSSTNGIG
jgi:hypothetical protein